MDERMKNKDIKKIIDDIVDKYNITLYYVEPGDEFCQAGGESNYINLSYNIGRKIWLGIYDDDNKKIASFFHEVGRIIDPIDWSVNADETTTYKSEKWAWEIGFKLAEI
jgi:hypothetical protein